MGRRRTHRGSASSRGSAFGGHHAQVDEQPTRTSEQRAVEIVELLGRVVARLRKPLLIVSLLPVVPVAVVLVVGILSGSWPLVVIAVSGLVTPAILTVRRRQLVDALQPPAAAVADLRAAFDPVELGRQFRSNLGEIDRSSDASSPRRLAKRLWRGVRFGTGTYAQFAEMPRLAPFLPVRLRGLALLLAACVLSAVAEGVVAALALLFTSLIST
jgi:hypothetical protein